MMEIYRLPGDKKEAIKEKLRKALIKRKEILFAYLHGSFLTDGPFRDIDVAVYVNGNIGRFYEEDLEEELTRLIGFPVDIRVLNDAPLTFRFRAIGGELLFSKDEKTRCRFEERTMAEYHDQSYYLELYRREALGI
ncbi:nucleotidyltransferase [Thermococcus siculi]|uniref:Nucleotidyltransferase n=1 Tax=Thermococcus siculi TaxID=72803 RepID=A0A2Z2MIT3_9EURY|nr:nucleotidyltransferase domain-containing protein [Thermococcus siculi]ASJ08352.1 nucleotidyltransferase [Thermococcus siculi]